MKKGFKFYFIAWAFFVVIFNIIAFIVPAEILGESRFTGSFWSGYIFITIAFIGQFVCAYFAFKANSLRQLFYNISLITISYTGLIVMFVIGGISMIFAFIPYWIAIIACIFVIGVSALAIIKAKASAEIIENVDNKIKVQTSFIKLLMVDAETLMNEAKSETAKNEMKKVYEAVRYSDPMSNDALVGIESQITIKFNELSNAVKEDHFENIQKDTNEFLILLNDRNKKCMILK